MGPDQKSLAIGFMIFIAMVLFLSVRVELGTLGFTTLTHTAH